MINHNIPLSYKNMGSFKMENTKKWTTSIIIDTKLLTYSDIHYYVYLVPHIAMEQYENQTCPISAQQNC